MNVTGVTPTNSSNTAPFISYTVITTSILIAIIGLAGNGLIVYAYVRFRQLQTITNYFVVNVAVTDLLLEAGLASWVVIEFYGDPSRVLRRIVVNIDLLCFSASMLTLTAASVDRYFAVTRPLRYEQVITRPRARKATAFTWIYSLTMFGISLSRDSVDNKDFDKAFITTLTIISFGIPALVMIFAHLSIFSAAWTAKKQSRDHELSRRRCKDVTKGIKLSLNTLVILFPMVTAWGVFYIITVLEAHCLTCYTFPWAFNVIVGLLPHAAAAIDPVVYILVTRDLRQRLCQCFS